MSLGSICSLDGVITKEAISKGIRLSVDNEGRELGHAYLYILFNDLHTLPFGFMEDVWVDADYRGEGHGTKLVQSVIALAQRALCYKLICTSRHENTKVHQLYEKLGFTDYGKEFRLDFA